ncbi:ABC transporter ATP-binding protein [Flavilitoribacter nigricans]|uniref:ATP-binding protein n=1 Tax=Flavilitoribacter nigricans (strain ATCC 23147 / DSM 23189 / NBRC 102662 / NCIMB 1420 / SS-2) TaxID=1122177 RepID=A0A2D0NFI4_FLAN2|nr:ABC transporter ATP-binding protein [Flavilitoribacter nigricans]PHN07251.1 ATP-binding protein [Flavilitoribacter nigricans DSM 23189 = NBRC 102662]
MIQIHNLSKAYGGHIVLQVPELEIPTGQSFGLVGNNGAGKTTLFSLLLDLIQPYQGEVRINDIRVNESSEWKDFTGAFLDESFLIGFQTPEEYFEFTGSLFGLNRSDVFQFLERFEVLFNGEILGKRKYIRDLSKGNQKKVGIAAALLGSPELVVLDEPFANLDPTSQIRLKQLIRELDDQKTVLISSHDLMHVTEVCERIVVLEKGEVIKDIFTQEDTLQELEAYFSV